MKSLVGLTLRLLWRDLKAGQLSVLLGALVLAVLGTTTVAFVADRVTRALDQEAGQLLGGDAVLRADRPIGDAPAASAEAAGLQLARTAEFPSMVSGNGRFVLAEINAVSESFPLRGSYELADGGGIRTVSAGPPAGSVWASESLLRQLDLKVGDPLTVGERELTLAAGLRKEPDAAVDYFDVAPRVVIAEADIDSTGLVQPGSRITYRLVVAGTPTAVQGWLAATRPTLERGQRLETVRDGRSEIRAALDRARQFLSLSLLAALVLAAVAVALAGQRYAERHLDAYAMLRVFGARTAALTGVMVLTLTVLGLLGAVLGASLAYAAQAGIAALLAPAFGVELPAPGLAPLLQGTLVGFVLLTGFALPPLLKLRRVPALKVLRRELPVADSGAAVVLVLALIALFLLAWLLAGDLKIAAWVLSGMAGGLVVLTLVGALLVRGLMALRQAAPGPWRLGLASLSRRAQQSLLQVVAFGLGLTALLLLLFAQRDLLGSWQASLPTDAPNRFLINVQPDQVADVRDRLAAGGAPVESLYPMIRGRLTAINGREVRLQAFDSERTRRLARREFNLSYAEASKADNEIVAGRWWAPGGAAVESSMEVDIAGRLGIRVGDVLTWDIAGNRVEAPVTSLRRVNWNSFTPNFFVVFSPGALDGQPTSWIGSFHLPAERIATADALLAAHPNISLIDLDRILDTVRDIADKVTRAVSAVFWFALAAGVLVLLGAIATTQDEREREGAILRTVGARRRQLFASHAAEFLAIGVTAGLTATLIAWGLTHLLARELFQIPFTPSAGLLLFGPLVGAALVVGFGLLGTVRVRRVPPLVTLRELG